MHAHVCHSTCVDVRVKYSGGNSILPPPWHVPIMCEHFSTLDFPCSIFAIWHSLKFLTGIWVSIMLDSHYDFLFVYYFFILWWWELNRGSHDFLVNALLGLTVWHIYAGQSEDFHIYPFLSPSRSCHTHPGVLPIFTSFCFVLSCDPLSSTVMTVGPWVGNNLLVPGRLISLPRSFFQRTLSFFFLND